MNCGQCVNFSASGYKNWGTCIAPLTAWAEEEGVFSSGACIVWVNEDDHGNYANECDLFAQRSRHE